MKKEKKKTLNKKPTFKQFFHKFESLCKFE